MDNVGHQLQRCRVSFSLEPMSFSHRRHMRSCHSRYKSYLTVSTMSSSSQGREETLFKVQSSGRGPSEHAAAQQCSCSATGGGRRAGTGTSGALWRCLEPRDMAASGYIPDAASVAGQLCPTPTPISTTHTPPPRLTAKPGDRGAGPLAHRSSMWSPTPSSSEGARLSQRRSAARRRCSCDGQGSLMASRSSRLAAR